jgi:hypothetical protein
MIAAVTRPSGMDSRVGTVPAGGGCDRGGGGRLATGPGRAAGRIGAAGRARLAGTGSGAVATAPKSAAVTAAPVLSIRMPAAAAPMATVASRPAAARRRRG